MIDFTRHTVETAPERSLETLERSAREFGFVPNVIGVLAEAPAAVNGYAALSEAFDTDATLSRAERHLLLLTVSVEIGSDACVPAHTAGARTAGLPDGVIDAVRNGTPIPDSRLRALHDFCVTVMETRGRVAESHIRAFLDSGFTTAQVLEVIVAVAIKTISNYANHIARTPIDTAFEAFAWRRSKAA